MLMDQLKIKEKYHSRALFLGTSNIAWAATTKPTVQFIGGDSFAIGMAFLSFTALNWWSFWSAPMMARLVKTLYGSGASPIHSSLGTMSFRLTWQNFSRIKCQKDGNVFNICGGNERTEIARTKQSLHETGWELWFLFMALQEGRCWPYFRVCDEIGMNVTFPTKRYQGCLTFESAANFITVRIVLTEDSRMKQRQNQKGGRKEEVERSLNGSWCYQPSQKQSIDVVDSALHVI